MYLVYNSLVLPESTFSINNADRAFQYGDGLFETIRFQNSQIKFWPDHYDRLTRGMAALQIEKPESLTAQALHDQLTTLLTHNNLTARTARIKIQVWRQPGGLYTPTNCSANILITARLGNPFSVSEKEQLGVFEAIRLSPSVISTYKTTNALPYVLAGLAKQSSGFDDIILLDTSGHMAECVASALFWLRADTLFMPALNTGCIDGILRRQLLRMAPKAGFAVQEGLFFPEELATTDAVFCGNVMGIQRFRIVKAGEMIEKSALNDAVEERLATLFGWLS